ncbi:bifunctional cobalt-precorrin-7 (C(5))-methyltransferase/cobalt-precorrin-6B (C(15))-methyltransferase [Rhodococcoides fascians]|uniref:bifunctional cobalt-precorrin-7 (C(5))-methyltransferase/cobalt-precorrin-6B (C(15))-methyltransferase n=1 Tax=Rhodococcoides fascians TaxID=1828 RepID=UPI00056452BB|nr:bifunctional cobalt-precorrin-7 (C(5))-methyltransferase/cobalt-precorrin-6B (C(15))-methyltransferase [Rhodococcus sp. 15-1189-1-1a]OZF09482.1 bifunctional cobalt-precorrin-7 (C(5))-methyltransferase/cobalt-precorrin-6B (C(15))-methyltransferase [Rhodococcus sp. 14-2686-1-2]
MAEGTSVMSPQVQPISVVGIGADGWDGLAESARALVSEADVVFGSRRQLDSTPVPSEKARRWPTPLVPSLHTSFSEWDGRKICVLASGDPMFHGIGVTLAREFGAARLHVVPAPSSVSLACARLGWAVNEVATVNLVNTPPSALVAALAHRARIVVLSRDQDTPAAVAERLCEAGYSASPMIVLEQLGGSSERSVAGEAGSWTHPAGDPLNVVAIDCVADDGSGRLTRVPGLPDEAYSGDGQLTKAEVRALTVSALAPAPGELLWDVGGGSGSISIEWMRIHPRCRAVAFESAVPRRAQIIANASTLGVPGLRVLGRAPHAFEDVPDDVPDAVFIGGGLTNDAMIDACWDRLRVGGRLVANAVTAESESLLLQCLSRFGGSLRRFQIYRAEPLGSFTGWRPQMPVTQWTAVKR